MKKRVWSMLLALALCLTLLPAAALADDETDTNYNLWVNVTAVDVSSTYDITGTQVTSANMSNIRNDANRTAVFTPADADGETPAKLTLTNYNGGPIMAGFPLVIELVGDNTIRSCDGIDGIDTDVDVTSAVNDLTLTGDGDLTITSEGRGIYAYGTLTINGGGELTVTSGDEAIAIEAINGITISGSRNVAATSGDDAIQTKRGAITINGRGDITLTAKAGSTPSKGIYTRDGSVAISGSGNIDITSFKTGIATRKGDAADASITISGERNVTIDNATYYDIDSSGSVTINGSGNISLTVNGENDEACGIMSLGSVAIGGSGAVVVGNDAGGAPVFGIAANGDLTISGSRDLTVNAQAYGLIPYGKIRISGTGKTDVAILSFAPLVESGEEEEEAGEEKAPVSALYSQGEIEISDSLNITTPKNARIARYLASTVWNVVTDANGIPAKHVVIEPKQTAPISVYIPTYAVNIPDKTENGSVTVSPKNASKGSTVTITVKPDEGYTLETLTATDKDGKELKLTDKGDGKYTFTMPSGKVEIKAAFAEEIETSPFLDVTTDAYYYDAVKWAAKNGITGGVGNNRFAPNNPCSRAQIVTFLWRAAGSPEPKDMNGFTDVAADSYYAKAVAWAVENGITTGTSATTFSPDADCIRAQAVTFLFRASGNPVEGEASFGDVPADSYYANAVAWAVKNGVTEGTGNGKFSPTDDCSRAQIATFLYRVYQGK